MKCSEMHDCFEDEDVRIFLAKEMRKDGRQYSSSAYILERKIKELQEELEKRSCFDALVKIADTMGWKEYDLSDEIENYTSETYYSFIGTEEEYQENLIRIKNGY